MSALVSESLRRRLRSGDLVLHVREIAGANHDENRPLLLWQKSAFAESCQA